MSNRTTSLKSGSAGEATDLVANFFKVELNGSGDNVLDHYQVTVAYDDGTPVGGKQIKRKIIERLMKTDAALAGKNFAYDGMSDLFIVVPTSLTEDTIECDVVLEDSSSNRIAVSVNPEGSRSSNERDPKRARASAASKTFRVTLNHLPQIPVSEIRDALQNKQSGNFQLAMKFLDAILIKKATDRDCFLAGQSFFHRNHSTDSSNILNLGGGGVQGYRGFHSSFKTTRGGLFLNMDVSHRVITSPESVTSFLTKNQGLSMQDAIDWKMANVTLKNLWIKETSSKNEYKITGISDFCCYLQRFTLKSKKKGNGKGDAQTTVYNHFVKTKGVKLHSPDLRCIDVGKPGRPIYLPIELCTILPGQWYIHELGPAQSSAQAEEYSMKPHDRAKLLSQEVENSGYNADPLLVASGISVIPELTPIKGRVLDPPKLILGNKKEVIPVNGRWNFDNQNQLAYPKKIDRWAIVDFSTNLDVPMLRENLARVGHDIGVSVVEGIPIFKETDTNRTPHGRVEEMFKLINNLPLMPRFLLCLLPETTSPIYGPWKRKCLVEVGIINQCLSTSRVDDQVLINVLLKINAKLGGINSLLEVESTPSFPSVSYLPTMIVGMVVSHGSPDQRRKPSIATVVSSRRWPLISCYRAFMRTQPQKEKCISSLCEKISDSEDRGIVRQLLLDFYVSSAKRKPQQIIIFREGMDEAQFAEIIDIELKQFIQACEILDGNGDWKPKFTVIVAKKKHNIRFFRRQGGSYDNVKLGTVIDDDKSCHPLQSHFLASSSRFAGTNMDGQQFRPSRLSDFYMCSQAGMTGTTRPTHYHILLNQLGFSANNLQRLVHYLSYIYQRCATAISIVAPIAYAHRAARQMEMLLKDAPEDEASSDADDMPEVQELPRLHDNVSSTMFFC